MNLQQSTQNFEETRRKLLYDLIKQRYQYEDVPKHFIQEQVNYYLEQLDKGKPILTLRPQKELTRSEDINEEMKELEIDIHSVFQQLNHLSQRVNQHQKLNESIINDIRLRIHKVDNIIEKTKYMIQDASTHSVFYETFLDYKGKEKDFSLYTERNGEEFAPAYHLTIDTYQNSLKLPLIKQENQLINFAGVKMANIQITKQLGSGFIRSKNPEHSIEKAIDNSMDTYWSESILVDEPLEVNLGVEYYGIDFGAVCEIEIIFNYISKVNEITLTPFTEFPIQVVSILVYDNDNDEEPYELVSPTAIHKSKESIDVISYQFQDVVAKRIKILLNQQHYTKKDLFINAHDKTLIDAWLQSQGHIEIDESKLFKPVIRDHYELYPYWSYINEYMKTRNIIDEIQRYETMELENRIQISKYEYQYGLYNIAVNHNEYFYEGVYVTNEIVNKNVHIVRLEATEEHPLLEELKMPVTNIEYYVTDSENPTKEDWHPILPMNTDEIISERLFVEYRNGAYKAEARFNIHRLRAVRRNGDALLPHVDYSVTGRTITLHTYDPTWIYTIDYKPSDSAKSIDFLKKYTNRYFDTKTNRMVEVVSPNRHMEEFIANGNQREFTLKYTPFIDKNELNLIEDYEDDWDPSYLSNKYLPIKVRLILPDGQYINQPLDRWSKEPIVLMNKTDYYDKNRNLLAPFNGSNYQYRIEDNKIKFNTELPKNTHIMVDYPYLTGPIRLKIIMRRNLHDVVGLTPFLHDYKLIIQSLT